MRDAKHILVAPLNWGLGHASRCVPVIRYLLEKGVHVTVVAECRPAAMLKQEFPGLDFVEFPGYEISYLKGNSMWFKMAWSIPKIIKGVAAEQNALNKFLEQHRVDGIISDNRYGMYSSKVPAVIITHQLNLQIPRIGKTVSQQIHKYIRRFDECWIPDYPREQNLAGALSKSDGLQVNTKYIGALSRFAPNPGAEPGSEIDVLAVLSGPEPQRTIFENLVVTQLSRKNLKVVLVSGKPDEHYKKNVNGIEVHSSVNSGGLQNLMQRSKMVLCRSGYSSIMDLAVLGKRAVFVPTPGQPEQEYLATLHREKQSFFSMSQRDFDWETCMRHLSDYKGVELKQTDLYKQAVNRFLEKC